MSVGEEHRDRVARFVRRQLDLGIDSWVLDRAMSDEALRIAADARWRADADPARERDAEPRSGSASGRAPDPGRAVDLGAGATVERGSERPAGGPTTLPVRREDPGATNPTAEGAAAAPRYGPGAGAAARAAPPADPTMLPDNLPALADLASTCTRCRLSGERTQVVFADGNPEARVVVVGEAPGANEDRTGLPFVGAAGKLLDLLLASVGLSREDSVYICNVIKCRPPGNRNPNPDEITACAPYLRRQIALVRPEAILAVGTFAAKLLSGSDRPLGKLRGEVYAYGGTPLVVTYHPAALLRSPGWTRPTWTDLQLLRDVIDGQQS